MTLLQRQVFHTGLIICEGKSPTPVPEYFTYMWHKSKHKYQQREQRCSRRSVAKDSLSSCPPALKKVRQAPVLIFIRTDSISTLEMAFALHNGHLFTMTPVLFTMTPLFTIYHPIHNDTSTLHNDTPTLHNDTPTLHNDTPTLHNDTPIPYAGVPLLQLQRL